jgi:ABC-type glycerol-3-phosphate transport system substrate-binding protein
MRRILIIIGLVLIPVIPIVLVVTGVIKPKQQTVNAVKLTMWGTADPDTAFKGVIEKYRVEHSYVSITYKQVPVTDYQNQLLQAWAQGTGPDIFFVPHTWVTQMSAYAVAQPVDIGVSKITVTKNLIGTSTTVSKPKQTPPTQATIKSSFVEAVAEDVIQNGQVWGYPVAMDGLALYSNTTLLNNAKIFEPAKTWAELLDHVSVKGLTILDAEQSIVQSGIALGTVSNLPYATDILTTLMMQNGAQMVDKTGKIQFQSAQGLTALNYFRSYATPSRESYSWNSAQPNARDQFAKGKVAYFIGTLADAAAIQKSGIKWQVTPMLHLDVQGDRDGAHENATRFINTPIYDVAMVSKASAKKSTQAWNFVNFMMQSGNVKSYLDATGKLSPIKKILSTQTSDATKSVFAAQLLTARTWYHGKKALDADNYLKQMITSIDTAGADPSEALNIASKQIQATL